MTEVTKAQLIYVADELNALLFNPPEIPVDGEDEEIVQKIHEAVDVLLPSDSLTDDLIDIISKTSLGAEVHYSKKKDMDRDISISDLFSERTNIPLEEPEPESGSEPEQEEEEVPEEVPVPEAVPEDEEKFGPVDLEDEEPDKLTKDVVDELEKNGHTATPPQMDYKELAKQLRIQGVVLQREKTKWEKGKSPYSIALEIVCIDPDMSLLELNDKFSKQTGLPLDKTTRPGIRVAMSLMRKVVGYLRDNGHMLKKTHVKRATTKK